MSQKIVVTVDDAALTRLDEIVGELRKGGMTVDQVLTVTGIVTGSATAHRLPALGRLTGVKAVEPDGEVRLLPPDGDVP